MLQNPAILRVLTVQVPTSGVYVTSGPGSSVPLAMPPIEDVLAWEIRPAQTIYIASPGYGVLTSAQLSAMVSAGQAAQITGVGGVLPFGTPPNGPGPFRLSVSMAGAFIDTSAAILIWTRP